MPKCETSKYLQIISGFVTWSVKTLHHRNAEMRNVEIPSDHFGVRDLECRNTSSQKCRNAFLNNVVVTVSGHICGRWRKELVQPSSISVIATWSVETLHHRNVEMRNCESTLWISAWSLPVVTSSKSCREELEETSSISEFGTWRVETTLHKIPEMRNAKCVFRIGPWS
jgi:hypothetical protein